MDTNYTYWFDYNCKSTDYCKIIIASAIITNTSTNIVDYRLNFDLPSINCTFEAFVINNTHFTFETSCY